MVRYAQKNDLEQLRKLDQHDRNWWVACDTTCSGTTYPFMNLLFLAEDERGKGYGTQLIQFWEEEMRRQQHRSVMISTRSDKQAQFFYRKHGYVDCGALLLHGEPLEILLSKRLPG